MLQRQLYEKTHNFVLRDHGPLEMNSTAHAIANVDEWPYTAVVLFLYLTSLPHRSPQQSHD